MAPIALSYFGMGSSTAKAEVDSPPKKTTIRALSTQWYTSPEIYECERRAIFSRRWLFMTHKSRLQEVGSFLRYDVAGYDFVIAKDRTGRIHAFHNVCRHRAYSVVEQEQGKANIFACRYHGWSYGLDGRLAKAPDYQELTGFDKTQNGLFPIHVHIDSKGFIWVNLDASEVPEVAWADEFANVDTQPRFDQFNFDDYILDHTYTLEGNYNWKILADNFNECYHCKTTHPDVPTFLTIDSHDCEVEKSHIEHDHAATPEQRAKGFNVNSTYYFPNASMSISPHFIMIQKFLPSSPKTSTMHYEIFRNVHSARSDFETIASTYARVMAEDKVLCERAQKNLNAGIAVDGGELHPRWEKGPLGFQRWVRGVVGEWLERERREGGAEIWPAARKREGGRRGDEEVCEGLKAVLSGRRNDSLAW